MKWGPTWGPFWGQTDKSLSVTNDEDDEPWPICIAVNAAGDKYQSPSHPMK